MAADGDVNLTISGDDAGLIAALDQAAASVTEKVGEMKETFASIGEGMNSLVGGFGAFAAIFAGGEIASQMNEVAERAEQISLSAQTMGVSTAALQGLQAAAATTGVSSEQLSTVMAALQGRMAQAAEIGGTSAERFTALGISMQELRDPSFSVIDAMTQMGSASNSNAALLAVLGARGAQLIPLMRSLAENHNLVADAAKEVGALLPGEIDALQRYKDATALLGIEFDNLKGHLGAYVVESSGPLMSAIESVMHGFSGTVDSTVPLKVAFGTLEAAAVVIVDAFKLLAQAAVDSVRDAVDVIAGLATVIDDVFTGSWQKTEADAKAAYGIIKQDGTQTFTDLGTNIKSTFTGVVDSYTAAFKGASAEASAAAATPMRVNPLVDLSTTKTLTEQIDEQFQELGQKVSAEMDKTQQQITATTASGVQERESLEIAGIDRQISAVQAAYKSGQITAQQDLQETQSLLTQKWQAQQDYYDKLETLYAADAQKLAQVNAQEENAHQAYLTAMQRAEQTYSTQITAQWQTISNSLKNSTSQAFTSILEGTETLGQGVQKIFDSMAMAVIQSLAKMMAQWAIQHALGLVMNREESQSNAAVAASGAAKSAAQIPIIGWILAPVAAAAVYAMASGFSAEGGFDVPAGLNPKTQLHEKEMVLPAQYADMIRSMAGGDGAGGAGGATHVHIHATDADSFRNLLTQHNSVLRDHIAAAVRGRPVWGH